MAGQDEKLLASQRKENTVTSTTDIHKPTRNSRTIKSGYRKVPGERSPGRVILRYDDKYGNGHNTFSITMESKAEHRGAYGGCMHDTIRKVFPEYAHLIKWHLFSTDGPMHYIANTLYYAGESLPKARARLEKASEALSEYKQANKDKPCGEHAETYIRDIRELEADIRISQDRLTRAEGTQNLDAARRMAMAPEATLEQLQDRDWLEARLPELLGKFRAAMDAVFGVDWVSS